MGITPPLTFFPCGLSAGPSRAAVRGLLGCAPFHQVPLITRGCCTNSPSLLMACAGDVFICSFKEPSETGLLILILQMRKQHLKLSTEKQHRLGVSHQKGFIQEKIKIAVQCPRCPDGEGSAEGEGSPGEGKVQPQSFVVSTGPPCEPCLRGRARTRPAGPSCPTGPPSGLCAFSLGPSPPKPGTPTAAQ